MSTVVDPDAIPEELRDREQWLLWDRSNHTPRRPHWDGDFHVSWSDPDTWHSFPEAIAKTQEAESWGVGYVTAANNPDHPMGVMTVLDIDGAADDDDRPKDWLPSLSPFFEHDAYIEWSPSHHEPGDSGLHIPIAGTPPDWWSDTQIDDHEGIDVLANKFSTVTGDPVDRAGSDIPSWNEDWVRAWLSDAYEALTGEQPAVGRRGRSERREDTAEYDDDWPDADTAEEMLDHIDADCAYEKWRNIGFALADHFPQHAAKRLFDMWSRSGRKYDDDASRLIDDIAGRGEGRVGIGTLVHHAKNAGWEPENQARTPSPKELVARASDEYDSAADVPDGVFETVTTDGGAAAQQTGTAPAESDGEGGATDDEDNDAWKQIRLAYAGAQDADERLGPRHQAKNRLMTEHEFRTLIENDQLWIYDEDSGIYRPEGERRIREKLTAKLADQFRRHEANEIVEQIKGRSTVRQDIMGGDDGYIPVKNGVLEVAPDTVELHDHDPSFNHIARADVRYDPDADAERFKQFIDESVENDRDKEKLQEYAGYLLLHWDLPHHKALFLVGPTASGKSTFLDTMRAMLGDEATSSLTPQQMTEERFGGAELYGSWANIRNDIPSTLIQNTGQFKEITAGDPIKAEEKYKEPFFFRPTTKHAFSANELPDVNDDDEAFFRRILLVAFPTTVPKDERDPRLDQKLQSELAGVLNWAIEGLQRLLEQHAFTGDRPPWQTQETWAKWGASTERFIEVCLQEGSDNIRKSKLYQAYTRFCEDESIPAESQHKLTREMKEAGFQDGQAYDRDVGRSVRQYQHVELTDRGQEYLADSDGDETTGTGIADY